LKKDVSEDATEDDCRTAWVYSWFKTNGEYLPVTHGGKQMINPIKRYVRKVKKQFETDPMRVASKRAEDRASIRLNGSSYLIRPVLRTDSDRLFQMHRRLSKQTLYFRYLAPIRPSMIEMRTLCSLSVAEGAAFVALCKEKDEAIVGLAYYRFDPNHPDENPEFAIVVEDQFQGSGLGKVLLTHLCRYAENGGFCGLNATIHVDNHRMRNLLYRIGYPSVEYPEYGTMAATVYLHSCAAATPGKYASEGLPLGHVKLVAA
jgi:RimJ/RimL family protein N-acetyltransferase